MPIGDAIVAWALSRPSDEEAAGLSAGVSVLPGFWVPRFHRRPHSSQQRELIGISAIGVPSRILPVQLLEHYSYYSCTNH